MRRRRGRFCIGVHLIDRAPKAVIEALKECIVVRAEAMFENNTIEYLALSEKFDEISDGERAPWYDCETTDLRGGKYHVVFKRRASR